MRSLVAAIKKQDTRDGTFNLHEHPVFTHDVNLVPGWMADDMHDLVQFTLHFSWTMPVGIPGTIFGDQKDATTFEIKSMVKARCELNVEIDVLMFEYIIPVRTGHMYDADLVLSRQPGEPWVPLHG